MFNNWFGKDDPSDLRLSGSEKNGNGNGRSTERIEQIKRLLEPRQAATEGPDRNNRKPVASPIPPTFEQIYQTATVKPPKLAYGIQKIAEMGNSPHLAGMSSGFKRKALLMALESTGTDVGEC
jgi:hypothetical protein